MVQLANDYVIQEKVCDLGNRDPLSILLLDIKFLWLGKV